MIFICSYFFEKLKIIQYKIKKQERQTEHCEQQVKECECQMKEYECQICQKEQQISERKFQSFERDEFLIIIFWFSVMKFNLNQSSSSNLFEQFCNSRSDQRIDFFNQFHSQWLISLHQFSCMSQSESHSFDQHDSSDSDDWLTHQSRNADQAENNQDSLIDFFEQHEHQSCAAQNETESRFFQAVKAELTYHFQSENIMLFNFDEIDVMFFINHV